MQILLHNRIHVMFWSEVKTKDNKINCSFWITPSNTTRQQWSLLMNYQFSLCHTPNKNSQSSYLGSALSWQRHMTIICSCASDACVCVRVYQSIGDDTTVGLKVCTADRIRNMYMTLQSFPCSQLIWLHEFFSVRFV